MRAYIGPLSSLVRLPYVSTLQGSTTRAGTDRVTLGGVARMHTARAQRRSWEVTVGGMRPDEIGELAELLYAGRPPWYWVDPWAQVTNLLTPAQSMLAQGSFQGSAQLDGRMQLDKDSYSRWSIKPQGWIDVGVGTPVEPGTPVSGSAWVTGPRVEACLVWQNVDGSYVESRPVLSTSGTRPKRIALGGRPRSTVRSVALRIKGATAIARPALTWTPAPVQWSLGQGCSSAIVLDLPQEIVLAYRGQREPRSADVTFTVQEVG